MSTSEDKPSGKQKSFADTLVEGIKAGWHRQRKLKEGQVRDPGPHGKTREGIIADVRRRHSGKPQKERRQEPRDRSLNGKARIKARKEGNKKAAAKSW